MKSFLLPLLAALALPPAARAQTAPAPGPAPTYAPAPGQRPPRDPQVTAQKQTRHLARRLGLSPDQQAKVQAILLQQHQQAQMLPGSDRRAARQAQQANRQQADQQLRAVLTPAQLAQYEQLRADQRTRARQRRQGGA